MLDGSIKNAKKVILNNGSNLIKIYDDFDGWKKLKIAGGANGHMMYKWLDNSNILLFGFIYPVNITEITAGTFYFPSDDDVGINYTTGDVESGYIQHGNDFEFVNNNLVLFGNINWQGEGNSTMGGYQNNLHMMFSGTTTRYFLDKKIPVTRP